MTSKPLFTIAAVAVAVAASAGTSVARGPDATTARDSAGAGIRWTSDQLQQLANAYQLKNPGWHPPLSAEVHQPANLTWTADNLDRLASAYAALNPGWTRPAPAASAARAKTSHRF
jgi:hypothetical protein